MTERKSKRKVVILRSYFLTESICCDVHVWWLYRVRQLNILLKNRRKVFLCWGFVRNVYLLDRWLSSQRTWPALRQGVLGREEGSNNQIASGWQAFRNGQFPCEKRSFAVCNVGHQIIRFGQLETTVSSAKRTDDRNVEAGSGGLRDIEGSANSKRAVLSKKRTCWAHRGTLDGDGCLWKVWNDIRQARWGHRARRGCIVLLKDLFFVPKNNFINQAISKKFYHIFESHHLYLNTNRYLV